MELSAARYCSASRLPKRFATQPGNTGEMLDMSGPAASPYREGPLGVIAEAADADLLL